MAADVWELYHIAKDFSQAIDVAAQYPADAPGLGKLAAVKLLVNGRPVAAGRVERTVPPGYSTEGFDVGRDNISAVSPDDKSPFPFSGTIRSVTIAVEK